ncbi:amidohydrolase family protein [Planctomicrobium sp. SH661]|uniref:amidohydrolase family protein n=1 Tax=Planctomicrobium sp. SH661 TaxID=3448124 RepID=UPI003F5C35D4
MSEFDLLSRRGFLGAGAAAVAAGWGVKMQAAEEDEEEGNYIDAHVHVWTPDVNAYPLAKGYTKEEMRPASFTPDELFSECRPAGVDRIVLIQMSYYSFDNSYVTDVIAKYPEVFRGVAIVDEHRPDLRDAMLKFVGDGVRGFRVISNKETVGTWEKSEGMQTMWEVGAEADLKICLLADPDTLPAIQKMCKKYPDTPVVIDHMARIGMSGTIVPKDVENLCRLGEFENVYVKTSAFYALGSRKAPYKDLGPMIRKLRDAYGAQRLMWASDCPFQVQNGHTYKESIDLIKSGLDFLSEEDRNWILRDTAEEVFFS